MNTLTAELIHDFASLDALREPWQALTSRISDNTDFFATWDYTRAYLQHHQPSDWCVVAVREASSPALVAVFALKIFQIEVGDTPLRACQPLGTGYLPYVEFPVLAHLHREVLQLLIGPVLQQQLRVEAAFFWPLHHSSRLYRHLLEDLGRSPAFKALRLPGHAYEIDSRGQEFEQYQKPCSRTTWLGTRTALKRLMKRGTVRFTLQESTENVPALLRALCQQNQEKFGTQHAAQCMPQWADFLQAAIPQLVQADLAQLSTLRINGEVLASSVSVLHKGRRYCYLFDYDLAFAHYSPGKILLSLLIAQSFEERSVFCFGADSGASASHYHRKWNPVRDEFKGAALFLTERAQTTLAPRITNQHFAAWKAL